MSKSKWIKRGPHKGTRSPHGGPAKTARGTKTHLGPLAAFARVLGGEPITKQMPIDALRAYLVRGDRPPRGMQGGD